jgi:hypothetical protein
MQMDAAGVNLSSKEGPERQKREEKQKPVISFELPVPSWALADDR